VLGGGWGRGGVGVVLGFDILPATVKKRRSGKGSEAKPSTGEPFSPFKTGLVNQRDYTHTMRSKVVLDARKGVPSAAQTAPSGCWRQGSELYRKTTDIMID